MDTTIAIWWDSITMWARDLEKWWRVSRLKSYLWKRYLKENGHYGIVYNLGIDGDTSTGKLKRFAVEAEARKPDIIMFATGANDCTYSTGRNYYVPVETFRANMVELINQARRFTDKIVIIWLIPCDETKTIPIPRLPEFSQDMKWITLYNDILKDVAVQEHVSFVDMLDVIGSQDLEDGMHPMAQGHEKMFVRIKDFLEDNNLI